MVENDTAYSEFEALWQQTGNPQEDSQIVEIDGVNTEIQILPLLQRLSRLADSLDRSDIIDTQKYDQMLTSIEQIEEVIQSIEPAVLSEVLETIN